MTRNGHGRRALVVGATAIAVGALLALIGVRFLLAPDLAARQFGVATVSTDAALHRAIGLRDLWLGLIAIGLAVWRFWPGLTLWFAAGMVVCLGDAALVLASSGSVWPMAFHLAAGALFAGGALGSWRLWR